MEFQRFFLLEENYINVPLMMMGSCLSHGSFMDFLLALESNTALSLERNVVEKT